MENIKNKKLYEKAKQKADKVYKRHSAYKSMYIQKIYKDMGGKYKNKKPKNGVNRWIKEEWIQVIPYLTKNKKIPCGAKNKKNKVCRPLKKIDKNTPITLPELLKLHSKKDIINLAKKKNKNMDGRVFWASLKFYPKKK